MFLYHIFSPSRGEKSNFLLQIFLYTFWAFMYINVTETRTVHALNTAINIMTKQKIYSLLYKYPHKLLQNYFFMRCRLCVSSLIIGKTYKLPRNY